MTVWQRVKLQEWTEGISVAGKSAAISPCFRYPKMASEAPRVGGGVSPSLWPGTEIGGRDWKKTLQLVLKTLIFRTSYLS